MDPAKRIAKALEKLKAARPQVKVAKPAPAKALAKLEAEAGPLPPQLITYLAHCDGVTTSSGQDLFSVARMLEIDSPAFFAISEDLAGDYDLVAAEFQTGPGAVVFWEHETGKTDYLIASSVAAYVDLWVQRTIAPERTLGKWPFDSGFMEKHDPEGVKLAKSRTFKKQLGLLEVQRVQRTGRAKARMGVNPFTGEPMELPAAPTKRRPR